MATNTCYGGTLYYVCAANNFAGCCSVDPCALDDCPDSGESPSSSSGSSDDSSEDNDANDDDGEDSPSSKRPSPKGTKTRKPAKSSATSDAASSSPTSDAPSSSSSSPTSDSSSVSSSIASASSSPSAIAAAETTASSPLPSSSSNGSSSTPAIAGGVIGAIILFVILGILLFLWRRKKRVHGEAPPSFSSNPSEQELKAEKPSRLSYIGGFFSHRSSKQSVGTHSRNVSGDVKDHQSLLPAYAPRRQELDSSPVANAFEMPGSPGYLEPQAPAAAKPLSPLVPSPRSELSDAGQPSPRSELADHTPVTPTTPRPGSVSTTNSGTLPPSVSPAAQRSSQLLSADPSKGHLMSWMDYERAATDPKLANSPAATLHDSWRSSIASSSELSPMTPQGTHAAAAPNSNGGRQRLDPIPDER
ncbi:MAG: hypothetical protein M1825_002368 [Sarcosagium campestre]|nr:MAG: hypothetical protein M1825_002368 [Sarcosagium campestre]